jgi:hypothetical protein
MSCANPFAILLPSFWAEILAPDIDTISDTVSEVDTPAGFDEPQLMMALKTSQLRCDDVDDDDHHNDHVHECDTEDEDWARRLSGDHAKLRSGSFNTQSSSTTTISTLFPHIDSDEIEEVGMDESYGNTMRSTYDLADTADSTSNIDIAELEGMLEHLCERRPSGTQFLPTVPIESFVHKKAANTLLNNSF